MRCFIAIDIPASIKEAIDNITGKLSRSSADIRWIPSKNVHLTLKFLGEVEDAVLPDIEKRISISCEAMGAFSINIRGIGAFPDFKHPNVLWMGIDRSNSLEDIYLSIEDSLKEMGFEKDNRRFSPHLTIARIKDRKGIDTVFKELYTYKDTFFGSIDVNEVLLMKSVLKPAGAEYFKLSGFKLRQ